jgi:hypothetical protein
MKKPKTIRAARKLAKQQIQQNSKWRASGVPRGSNLAAKPISESAAHLQQNCAPGFPTIDQMRRDLARANPLFANCEISDADLRRVWEGACRLDHLRGERLQKMDFEGYLRTFDGHERFAPFLEIYETMPDADYWKCLALVWDNIEVSFPDLHKWIALFESNRPQRHHLMSESDLKSFAAMPEKLTVFRGYAKGTAKNGLSWTLLESKARWFATEYASGGRRAFLCGHATNRLGMIVAGQCNKRDVLAYFNEREESEIVIRPDKVFAKRSEQIAAR